MNRSAITIILLLTMLWQSVGVAHAGLGVHLDSDRGHALMHWQETAHHHDDDGNSHVDESAASSQHLLADHVACTADLLPTSTALFAPAGSSLPGMSQQGCVPRPYLDGLLRPPRLSV